MPISRGSAARFVLGVDAGNSKTIALVARCDGAIVGTGRGGCGDIYGAASAQAALDAVGDAVGGALRMAGIAADALAAGTFSMAGADWPEDYASLHAAMERRGFGQTIVIVHDALGALRAGSPENWGVAVVCGTGAAIGGRAPDGRIWHTSFWQEGLGGGSLGTRMLRAVLRAELGIDPPTSLTALALAFSGQPTVEAMLHAHTAHGIPPFAGAARLAPLLLDAAEAGDPTACAIVLEHGIGLGDYALATARCLGIVGMPFPLVLAGGVLRHPSPLLEEAIVAQVRSAAPDTVPVRSRFEPAVGALLLALEAASICVDDALLARLEATAPAAALYATHTAPGTGALLHGCPQ